MIKLKVTLRKDGQVVNSFRDTQGRRVRISDPARLNWTTARKLTELGLYWIKLQREQALAGLGSDGSPMPALKPRYQEFKAKVGLEPKRNLYGLGGVVTTTSATGTKRYLRSGTAAVRAGAGGRGHMLDDIRINSISDTRVTVAITTRASKTKAAANQKKAPWWGLGPVAYRKFRDRAFFVLGITVADQLFTLGLIGATALSRAKASVLRRAA